MLADLVDGPCCFEVWSCGCGCFPLAFT